MEPLETPETVEEATDKGEKLSGDTVNRATDTTKEVASGTVDEVGGQLPFGLGRVLSMLAGRPTLPRLLAGVVVLLFVLVVGRKFRR